MSLVELLVVASVLAILAMLLLPAIATVRLAANGAGCQSRLRQLGVGMQFYENDHRGRMVQISYRKAWANGGYQIYSWDTSLRDYADDGSGHDYSTYGPEKRGEWDRLLVCPNDRIPSNGAGTVRRTYAFTGLVGTYADGLRHGMAEPHQGTPYAPGWWMPALPRSRAKPGSILLAERPHANNKQGADWLTTVRSPKEQLSAHKGLHGPGRFSYLFCDLRTQVLDWRDTWPADQDLATMDTIVPPEPWSVGCGR